MALFPLDVIIKLALCEVHKGKTKCNYMFHHMVREQHLSKGLALPRLTTYTL